ncbi:type II toxin-antitoxin system antitoxin, RelB/DinJ family [Candidatus Fermentibacteria bacterium]|nr:MAG: type II toxin-antitoxin system antitoxin, RelB/DinJ family [Candidatus Fermentibacteria bacterium]
MSKTATVRARLKPELKEKAEEILHRLGVNTSQAITMFYRQIEMNNGLPFNMVIPNATTKATFNATDANEEIVICENAEDMFDKLGI